MSIERQHYVTQGFLKGFCALNQDSNKFIWKYDKRYDSPPKRVSIRSVAWSSFYYEQETEAGERDTDTLEKAFAETLDNTIPDIIRSLDAKLGTTLNLKAEDKGALAYFLGLSLTRVPSFRDGINELFTKIAKAALEIVVAREPLVVEGIEKYGIDVSAKEWVSLKPMLEVANGIADSCLKKEWQFFVPPKGINLITSDNPVHFSIPKEAGRTMAGPGHPSTEIIVNLRRDLAVVCTPPRTGGDCTVYELSKQKTKRFNRGTARAAQNQIYASENQDGLRKLTKKYAKESQSLIV